jgi:hypothetical protein
MKTVRRPLAGTLAALALAFAVTPAYSLGRPPAITVADQSIKNNSINVDSASVDKLGYLVIHLADPNGKVIGVVAVPAGEHKNVAVPLTVEVTPGTQLVVMLHEESDGDTKFDANDKPALVDGAPVTGSLTVK